MNKVLGYRKMLGKTQQQMAKELNISEQSYRNREKGKINFKKNEMIKFKIMLLEKGLKDITLDVKLRERSFSMPYVNLQNLPTKENVVTEPNQVVVKPIMAKPNAIAKLFGISYSSVNRILKEYDKDNKGIDDLYYSLSSTMTVISIPRFEEYMKQRHKDWM